MTDEPHSSDLEYRKHDNDLALKRYDIVLRYLAYEHTAFWSRNQFYLVANAGLFGFAIGKLPTSAQAISSTQLLVTIGIFVVGTILGLLWLRSFSAGKYWIERWWRLCELLEPKAFGETEVLRNSRPPRGHKSVKSVARYTAILFVIVWSVSLIYLLAFSAEFYFKAAHAHYAE